MFRKMLTALAKTTAAVRVFGWINRPGSANAAAMPSQAESGNSTPAESNDDAQPIMQRGGRAVSTIAMAAVHGLSDSFRVQQKNQGNDRSAAAAIHMKTALASLDGQ
jgi:hypothetical protein